MRLNQEKLQTWARQIHKNACAHGFHDEKKSDSHWLCMIMTEVAEAVDADRKGQRANTQAMKETLRIQKEGEIGLTEQWYQNWYSVYFNEYIKGSVDEEFADIFIRILDFAYEKFGEEMHWETYRVRVFERWSFTEAADYLVRGVLNSGMANLSESIEFVYEWAKQLGIDLDFHIEAKMKYNETRPLRHGKKY